MTKAYGYIRVSGKGQVNGDGLVRQETAIREYAEKNGYELVGIFREEGVSGTEADRPELARLMFDLEENGHGIKTVLIERIDRLARDLMVQEFILQDFQKQGFELVSVHDGEGLQENDPTRTLIRQVLGAVAQYDKTMTVLKLKAARERKRLKEGKCEGRKGYRDSTAADLDVVREIKRLRRKPAAPNMRRKTFRQIADILNGQGRLTIDGKAFTSKNVSNILYRHKGRL